MTDTIPNPEVREQDPSTEHVERVTEPVIESTSAPPADDQPVPTSDNNSRKPKPPAPDVEWGLKEILWPPESIADRPQRPVRIVMQHANGPCSFIAICNILILRGAISIEPKDRKSAGYEYLSSLVGDYLVNTALDVDIAAVFSVLPKTQHGMDLNPLFTGLSSFRPAGEGGELKLFQLAGITLVHGWLVDPDSLEYTALSKTEDYDNSLNAIVEADHATSGRLVQSQSELNHPQPEQEEQELTPEVHRKIEEALIIRGWIDANPTQLTYYGLFALNDSPIVAPNELVAFFRGSHLSVLYRRQIPGTDDTSLYTLVTDRVFLREPSVVWESLQDVDGQSSQFYDSNFMRASPAGGDFAGQTSEQIARAYEERERREREERENTGDVALARQLQAEEDAHARYVYEEQRRRRKEAEQEYLQRQHQQQQHQHRSSGSPGDGTQAHRGDRERLADAAAVSAAERKQKKREKEKEGCIAM